MPCSPPNRSLALRPVCSASSPHPNSNPRASFCALATRPYKSALADDPGPTPWLTRKFAVGIVFGVFFYSYYVFLATLVVPSLRHANPTWATRSEAIAFLVIFNLLWLMFIWSYLKVVLTPPGFVRDSIQPKPPPTLHTSPDSLRQSGSSFQPGPPYVSQSAPRASLDQPPVALEMTQCPAPDSLSLINHALKNSTARPSITPRYTEELFVADVLHRAPASEPLAHSSLTTMQPAHLNSLTFSDPGSCPGPLNLAARTSASSVDTHDNNLTTNGAHETNLTILPKVPPGETTSPPPSTAHPARERSHSIPVPNPLTVHSDLSASPTTPWNLTNASARSLSHVSPQLSESKPVKLPSSRRISSLIMYCQSRSSSPEQPFPFNTLTRSPPTYALLDPTHRYCHRCQVYKPPRSHHCRHCGTCVLKMDHHCPWIGQCVGARNYKYFVNFLQWSTSYCLYTFIVLLVINARPRAHSIRPPIDRQHIALLVISGFFAAFTLTLLATHSYLILRNMSTIEQMGIERLIRKEKAAIGQVLGRGKFLATWRVRKQFDAEWGSYHTHGNPWWHGGRNNWEMVMGNVKIRWLLPLAAKADPDDGLSYKLNPRYTSDGRWRRRSQWPAKYQ